MRIPRRSLALLTSLAATLTVALLGMAALPAELLRAAQEPAAPMASGFSQYYPTYNNNYFGNSATLYLDNIGTASSDFALKASTSNGSSSASQTINVPAQGQVEFPSANFSGLPSSFSGSLAVSSLDSVTSMIINRSKSGTDRVIVFNGQSSSTAALAFGPYLYNVGGKNTFVQIQNTDTTSVEVQFQFYALDGSLAGTSTSPPIPPGATRIVQGQSGAGLTSGFQGWVRVSTPGIQIVGLMTVQGGTAYTQAGSGIDAAGQTVNWLPRALKNIDEGGGPRSTTLFIANPGASQSDVVATFLTPNRQAITETFSLAGGAARFVDLTTLSQLPQGSYSVAVDSTQPVLLWEATDYDAATTYYSNADTYSGVSDGQRTYVPGLLKGSSGYSALSVQNTSSATQSVTMTYMSLAGTPVYSEELSLAPRTAKRVDLSSITALGDNFVGSAVVTGSGPVAAIVDLLVPPAATNVTPTPTGAVPTPTGAVPTPTGAVPTPTGAATATPNPTPPSNVTAPTLYINYDAGAPSSTFMIMGSNYPAAAPITITINGVAVGQGIVTDSSGRFTLLLQTPPAAGEGFYVIVAKTAAASVSLQQATPNALDLKSYRLTNSGPDAVVRLAPAGVNAPLLAVPASIAAKAELPLIRLPLVLK